MLTDLKRNIFVYSMPVDMRKSYDGLLALCGQNQVVEGDIFLFVAKNRQRAKVLFWDGTGLNIWMKRLEKGRFADLWKRPAITMTELKLFIEGSKLVRSELSPRDDTKKYLRPEAH